MTDPKRHDTRNRNADIRSLPSRPQETRRSYLELLGVASLGTMSGCLTNDGETNGDDGRTNESRRTATGEIDADELEVDPTFHEERSNAGTAMPELNNDPGEWEAINGSVTADTEDSVDGNWSLRLETDASQPQALAQRQLEEPRDFRDLSLSLAVNWEAPKEQWNRITLALRDESGDSLLLTQTVEAFSLDGWHRFDLGVDEPSGDPDLSSIVTVEVSTWVEDAESRVLVDDIRTIERASTSYVFFHFDDIRAGVYENAFPVLADHDYPATGGTIVPAVGEEGFLLEEQMAELADHGWEFCSHPQRDESFVEMDTETVESLLVEAKRWHTERGYDAGLDYIIYPYGEVDDGSLDAIARYHKLGFKVPRPSYGADVTSPLLCGRANGSNMEEFKTAIDRAEQYNTVVPVMHHRVGPDAEWSVTAEEFEESVRYVDDADDVEVITTSKWLSMLADGEIV